MAAAAPGRQSRTPCFFYGKGSCRSGARCRFAHGTSDDHEMLGRASIEETGTAPGQEKHSETTLSTKAAAAAASPSNKKKKKKACKYFAEGKCERGDACPFLHLVDDSGGSSADGGSGTKDDPITIGEKGKEVRPPYGDGGGSPAGGAADLGSWADVVEAAMEVDADSAATTTTTASSSSRSSSSSSRRYGGGVSPRGASAARATKERADGSARFADASDGDGGQKDENNSRPPAKETVCVFFLRGRCKFGDGCRFSHDSRESDGSNGSAERGRKEEAEEDPQESKRAAEEAALDEAERIQSRRAECGVCLERVQKVRRAEDRVFGILTGCKHVYCLRCINEWRDKSKSHECPECRMPSTWVMPSETLVTDPDRKKRLASEFRKSQEGGNPPPRRRHRLA